MGGWRAISVCRGEKEKRSEMPKTEEEISVTEIYGRERERQNGEVRACKRDLRESVRERRRKVMDKSRWLTKRYHRSLADQFSSLSSVCE